MYSYTIKQTDSGYESLITSNQTDKQSWAVIARTEVECEAQTIDLIRRLLGASVNDTYSWGIRDAIGTILLNIRNSGGNVVPAVKEVARALLAVDKDHPHAKWVMSNKLKAREGEQ